MHTVVKPFRYSANGVTNTLLSVGHTQDFGALAPGLEAEGLIEPAAAVLNLDSSEVPRDESGQIHGEPLNLADEERADLPPLDPDLPDTPEDRTLGVAGELVDASPTRDPLDHDGDGVRGGSLPKSKRKPRAS